MPASATSGFTTGMSFLTYEILPGLDLILSDATCLGGVAGNERGSAALNLTCTASCHEYLAVVRIEAVLNRHRDPLQREVVAGRSLLQSQRPPAQV